MNRSLYPIFEEGYYEGYIDGLAEGLEERGEEGRDILRNMVDVVQMNREDYSIKETMDELDLSEEQVKVLIGLSIKLVYDNVKEILECYAWKKIG